MKMKTPLQNSSEEDSYEALPRKLRTNSRPSSNVNKDERYERSRSYNNPAFENNPSSDDEANGADLGRPSQIETSSSNDKQSLSGIPSEGFKWAKKIFFTSSERLFPGIMDTTILQQQNQQQKLSTSHPNQFSPNIIRSSVTLAKVLRASLVYFFIWMTNFWASQDIVLGTLKPFHRHMTLSLTTLFMVVNIVRSYFGDRGNRTDEIELLAIYWMLTTMVQLPILIFILVTDIFTTHPFPFNQIMDSIMGAFIFLEFVVGFIQLKSFVATELQILRITRDRHGSTNNAQEETMD